MNKIIYINAHTCLKQRPIDASLLAEQERYYVNPDESFDVSAIAIDGVHTRLTLAKDASGKQRSINGKNTWWIYSGHCEVVDPASVGAESVPSIAPSQFRPNSIAIAVIAEFESLELKQYYCPANVSTIGYGSTRFIDGADVPVGAVITEAIARELLQRDLKEFIASLRSLVKVNLTGKQVAALTSFVYNLGAGALSESTLLRRLNDGESRETVAKEFLKWDKAGNERLPGLTRRREVEFDLWMGLE